MIRATDLINLLSKNIFTAARFFSDKINNELINENIILLINENNYFFDKSKLTLGNNYDKNFL